jgi:hypothetical protein
MHCVIPNTRHRLQQSLLRTANEPSSFQCVHNYIHRFVGNVDVFCNRITLQGVLKSCAREHRTRAPQQRCASHHPARLLLRYTYNSIARVDDNHDADGEDVLTFSQAQEKARSLAKETKAVGPEIGKLPTVAEAATHYLAWFKEHRKSYRETETTVNAHVIPEFGDHLITNLTTKMIRQWHERIAIQPTRKRTSIHSTKQAFREKGVGKHQTHVFSFNGRPIIQVSTKAWYKGLAAAGIEDFRWYDLRHTWVSWHVQNGTPLFALQELGGWESPEMVRRYAHLSADHLAPYADRLCALRVGNVPEHGTFTAQSQIEKGLA